ncbi:MAG: hypothetical protein L3J46_07695 [Kangiellaceae bacterium]|nr:hypothetical protein [Kangiellaceae bacterium]
MSTGLEHQEWVPVSAIINAAYEAISHEIPTCIMIEKDSQDSECYKELTQSKTIKKIQKHKSWNKNLRILNAAWMPFKVNAREREHQRSSKNPLLSKGCENIFQTIAITPVGELAACCGLTMERIKELKLGYIDKHDLLTMFTGQFDDFLKIWIYVDGPFEIIKKVIGASEIQKFEKITHNCQACAILHNNNTIRSRIKAHYEQFVADVLIKFSAMVSLRSLEISKIKEL